MVHRSADLGRLEGSKDHVALKPGARIACASISVYAASVVRQLAIWVAVQPAFTDFCRRDHGMLAGVRVLTGVAVRRAVAAQRNSAFLTSA